MKQCVVLCNEWSAMLIAMVKVVSVWLRVL